MNLASRRSLLEQKGTMSEAEIHLMRARRRGGILNNSVNSVVARH